MGDSDMNSERGYAIAQYARGNREPMVVYRVHEGYGWNGYAYVVGWFYHLFGFSPYAVKLLNCLFGAWIAPVVFALASACFNREIARWSGAIVAWVPSLMLWSVTNLKECSLTLTTLVVLWLMTLIQRAGMSGRGLGYGVLFLGGVWMHTSLRSPAYSVLLLVCTTAPMLWSYLWLPRVRIGTMAVAVVGVIWLMPYVKYAFATALMQHVWHNLTIGTTYAYLPPDYYVQDVVPRLRSLGLVDFGIAWSGMLKASMHYLLEPLPWRTHELFQFIMTPQLLAWYFSLPYVALGMLWALRWNARRSLSLLLLAASWTLLGGLTGGNVGTIFRMRDMLTPCFVIFAAVGVWGIVRGPERLAHAV